MLRYASGCMELCGKMSKLLNNKWVILGLAIVALAIIYNRVVKPLQQYTEETPDEQYSTDIDSILSDDDGVQRDTVEQELQLVTAQFDLKRIDTGSIRWNESPDRDPFSPRARLQNEEIQAIQSKAEASPVAVEGAFKRRLTRHNLSAIVNSSQKSFAVIDGKIVQGGDRVGGYQINEIFDKKVGLIHLETGRAVQLKVEQ